MFSFADTHCHLDFSAYDSDRDLVISRAREKGLRWVLNPGIDLNTSRGALKIAETHSDVYAAVGVHPNDADSWDSGARNELEGLAHHSKVVAIGEIGLDYYRDRTPPEIQKSLFQTQLELAADLDLPVIVHCRQAIDDVLTILKGWVQEKSPANPKRSFFGVLHSFEGSLENAREAIGMHFLIGVGGPVTFRNAKQKQELVKALPLETIVLETDAPFLTPHPYRGQRNEPAYIPIIAESIAGLHDLPLNSVAEITSYNAARLFSWRL